MLLVQRSRGNGRIVTQITYIDNDIHCLYSGLIEVSHKMFLDIMDNNIIMDLCIA